ncbi:hypothetical protein RIF29_14761 [Crotalaria pallida]|uniref:Uncharacterized protein n=1 Tax=Crotalaria pallida TaxID=3830 RepID=A0AAN9FBV2_CROPI
MRVDDPFVLNDRYRDSLTRILELALPMHQRSVLDSHAIQQISRLWTSALDHRSHRGCCSARWPRTTERWLRGSRSESISRWQSKSRW